MRRNPAAPAHPRPSTRGPPIDHPPPSFRALINRAVQRLLGHRPRLARSTPPARQEWNFASAKGCSMVRRSARAYPWPGYGVQLARRAAGLPPRPLPANPCASARASGQHALVPPSRAIRPSWLFFRGEALAAGGICAACPHMSAARRPGAVTRRGNPEGIEPKRRAA